MNNASGIKEPFGASSRKRRINRAPAQLIRTDDLLLQFGVCAVACGSMTCQVLVCPNRFLAGKTLVMLSLEQCTGLSGVSGRFNNSHVDRNLYCSYCQDRRAYKA